MRAAFPRCLTRTEPLILLSSLRYQLKRSLNNRERCWLAIRNCMRSYKSIFSRIRWNFLLRPKCGHPERSKAQSKDPAAQAQRNLTRFLDFARNDSVMQLLRLRNDSKIRLWRFPALRIPPLCFLVGDRAGDDNVLSWQPVDRRSHLMLRGELK